MEQNDFLNRIETAEADAARIRKEADLKAQEIIAMASEKAARMAEAQLAAGAKEKKRIISESAMIAEHNKAVRQRALRDEITALHTIVERRIDTAAAYVLEKVEAL